MANTAIGVDFGHSHIKLVEVRRRGRQTVIQRAALLPISQGILHNGAINGAAGSAAHGVSVEESLLAAALAEINPGLRIDRAVVAAGITGSSVIVRNITLTDVSDADLRPAVLQEMATLLRLTPDTMEEHVFDYHVLPGVDPDRREVVVVGLERQVMLSYVHLLRQARLAPHILDMAAFALPYALPAPGRICYIDIGAENTQVYITSDSEYLLFRLVPTGMSQLNKAIADAYRITPADALTLQKRVHIDTLLTEAPGDRTPLRHVIEEITGGVMQTFEFLRARQRASSITELLPAALLSGGGALQNGMCQLLSEETGLNIEIARPFAGRPGAEALPPDVTALEPLFAGALGLALRGAEQQ